MINQDTLCLSCMHDLGNTVSVCPYCQQQTTDQQAISVALPLRTLLNERFLIGRVLGRPGGFGITYLAWDTVLETPVAIKEFLPLVAVNRSPGSITVLPNSEQDRSFFQYGLEIFLQEAKTLAQFSHPNIVRIRDYFVANNTAYLVMDYHKGRSLDAYLEEQGGCLTEKQALDVLLPILAGLEVMHDKGFLHRDVKPQNIYLTESDIPLLLDFGAARLAMADATQTLTVVLSRGFAPFEQYHNKGRQGPWSDIYACGATLYYLVTGCIPPDALERQHQDKLLPPLKFNPQLTAGFGQAVMAAMATSPSARPQQISQFRKRLNSVAQQQALIRQPAISGTIATQPAANYPPPKRPQPLNARYPSPSRTPRHGSLILAAAIVCVLLLGWLTGGRRDKGLPPTEPQTETPALAQPAAILPEQTVAATLDAVPTASVPLPPAPVAEPELSQAPHLSSPNVLPANQANETNNSCQNAADHADCLWESQDGPRIGWCVPAAEGQSVCLPKPPPGRHPPFPHPPPPRHRPPTNFVR